MQSQIKELEHGINKLTRELHDKEEVFLQLKRENDILKKESGQGLQSVVDSLEEEI